MSAPHSGTAFPLLPHQLCCGISLLSLVLPEDLDVFLHHARSLLSAGDGIDACHVKFPCRIRSNDDSVIDTEFDLHMLRRSGSPYCFALYLAAKSLKAEPAATQPAATAASLDAAAMSLNPGMFLLGHLQQQQLAAGTSAQFMLGGLQHENQQGNMFMMGDFQQQQHPGMFIMPSSDAPALHSTAFS
jgi:hypothetical protein